MTNETIGRLSAALGQALSARKWRVSTAESCTAGALSAAITAPPGASAWFEYGFVTYADSAKVRLLDVPEACLSGADAPGAVSEQTVLAMARGALIKSGADLALATSGIAGPGGGSAEKPVGTIWLGWALRCPQHGSINGGARCLQLHGDREQVRAQTVAAALAQLCDIVNNEG